MGIVNSITLLFVGFISLTLAGVAVLLISGRGFLFQNPNAVRGTGKSVNEAFAIKEFVGKSMLLVAVTTPFLAFSVIYKDEKYVLIYVLVIVLVAITNIIFYFYTKKKYKSKREAEKAKRINNNK